MTGDTKSSGKGRSQTQPSSPAWEPGDVVLGLYEVRRKIGEGGMGEVFRVRHRAWNMELAVKIPKGDGPSATENFGLFEHECELWVNLGWHPHVVTCHFVRRFGGVPLVFMNLVSGGSLAQWIRSGRLYAGGPRSALGRIIETAIQSAAGLNHAHERGLVHGDVKPANILMESGGRAKITDFGLARAWTGQTGSSKADGAPRLLTPAYCSPEQARGQRLSPRSDLWSWAVSVLEMLVGEMRWLSGQAAPLVLKEWLQGVPPPSHVSPPKPSEVPRRLIDLLHWCFQEQEENRPGDMRVAIEELSRTYQKVRGAPYSGLAFTEEQERLSELANCNNRAVSLIELGKSNESESLLQSAYLKLKTADRPSAGTIAQTIAYNFCLTRLRQTSDISAETIRDIIPADPDPSWHAFLTAMLLLEAGYLPETIAALESVAGEESESTTDALNVRGIALLLAGETRPAVACFAEAVSREPERLDILRNLGLAYYYDGQCENALRVFRHLASVCVFDAEDAIRYAVVLSAAGHRSRAARWLWKAVGSGTRSSSVLLTAAELAAGCQSFLPGVTPVAPGVEDARAWVSTVASDEPANLRGKVDDETFPSRYGLDPGPEIQDRQRALLRKGPASRIAGIIGSSYAVLTRRHRWGDVTKRILGAELFLLSAIPAALAALLAGAGCAGGEFPLAAWTAGVAFVVAFLLMIRGAPCNNLLWEVLRLVPFVSVPLMVSALPSSDAFPALFVGVLHLVVPATLFVFVVWQTILQRLTVQARAFPQRFFRALLRHPIHRFAGARIPAIAAGRTDSRRADPDDAPFSSGERGRAMLSRRFHSIAPVMVKSLRELYAAFRGWQVHLLPQVALLLYLMNRVDAQDETAKYLPFLAMPLLLALFSPWLTLTLNIPASVYTAIKASSVFIERDAALLGAGRLLAETVPVDTQRIILAGAAALLIMFFSWRAFCKCPDFIPEWKSCNPHPWDIRQIVDPLNIREHAAPWQLVRPEIK